MNSTPFASNPNPDPEADRVQAESRLTALALGEGTSADQARFELDLASDPPAQAEVEATREMARLLTAALAREAKTAGIPAVPGVTDSAVRAVPTEGRGTEPSAADEFPRPPETVVVRPGAWRWGTGWTMGAIAAGLVAILALVLTLPGIRQFSVRYVTAQHRPVENRPAGPADSVPPVPSVQEPSPSPSPVSGPAVEVVSAASSAPAPVASSHPTTRSSSEDSWYGRSTVGDGNDGLASKIVRGPASTDSEPRMAPRTFVTAEVPPPASARPSAPAPTPAPVTLPAPASAPVSSARAMSSGVTTRGLADRGRTQVAPPPPPSTASSPSPSMRPELMRRYGLAPSPAGGAPAVGGPVAVEPALRSRYGLMVGPPEGGVRPQPYSERESRFGGETQNPGYVDVQETPFASPLTQPLSTFGLDVDTGSYANVRRFLKAGMFPPRGAVRVEEMINYFPYSYVAPRGDEVFGVRTEVAACPWEPRHRLVRVAIQARGLSGERPVGNLVFLIDVSGSMQPSERLPLIKQGLRSLVRRLAPSDRVAIVTYASSAGVHLQSTSCEEKDRILEAIDTLEAGGSTHGEGGIRQAYEVARRHLVPGGVNRVLLCTDGDFNVGMSNQDELVRLIEDQARSGVFLTTLGVGTDNFKDALMRRLADRGNGSYHYLDSFEEAQRVLLEQRDATFVTVARDAKAQVEFNPGRVSAWRLIGYEKRLLAAQDFNDDTKDAGEIGAGQTVTVLYEIVPAGEAVPGAVDALKYQPVEPRPAQPRAGVESRDLFTLKLRYQRPEGSKSVPKEYAVEDRVGEMSGDFRFAAAVAAFGMALKDPYWDGGRGFDRALTLGQAGLGEDPGGWRAEFLTLVRKARGLPRR